MKKDGDSWNTNRMGLERSMLSDGELIVITDTDHVQCGDAAAMARELLAYRKANEWIPISERFPDNETAILVADCEGVVWGAEVQDGTIYPDDWAYINRFGSREATHWKPMPEVNQQKNDV